MPAAPQPPVGHLVNHPDGPQGPQGIGYDYILAGNGIFVQASSPILVARIRIASADVRGLQDTDEKIDLPHGPIPARLIRDGIRWMLKTPKHERFFAIAWHGAEYRLHQPPQAGTAASLTYTPLPGAVAEFHSHARYAAVWSATDDADEQGFRIYGIIGRLDRPQPEMALRLGIYGHFRRLVWQEADGHLHCMIDPASCPTL